MGERKGAGRQGEEKGLPGNSRVRAWGAGTGRKEIMAVIVRRREIRSDINLVTYRLISCEAKLSSPRFCSGA